MEEFHVSSFYLNKLFVANDKLQEEFQSRLTEFWKACITIDYIVATSLYIYLVS